MNKIIDMVCANKRRLPNNRFRGTGSTYEDRSVSVELEDDVELQKTLSGIEKARSDIAVLSIIDVDSPFIDEDSKTSADYMILLCVVNSYNRIIANPTKEEEFTYIGKSRDLITMLSEIKGGTQPMYGEAYVKIVSNILDLFSAKHHYGLVLPVVSAKNLTDRQLLLKERILKIIAMIPAITPVSVTLSLR